MEQNINAKPNLKGYSAKAYIKFIVLSVFGIFAFFVNFPLPDYQISIFGWEFGAVSANSTMLVTHLTRFIRAALWDGNFRIMPAILWLFGVYCIADLFFIRPKTFWHTTRVAAVFSIIKIIGFVLFTFAAVDYYFGVHPAFLGWLFSGLETLGGVGIAFFVMDGILIPATIAVTLAAAFLPLLTDYGLVDFFGVFARRFMRPVFRLPGRAAVIAVGSLLANFAVGHIAANSQYKTGRMNRRESIVIATSLTSGSIGIMLVVAMNTGIMRHWNTYVWTTFLIILVVTIITSRVYPLSKVPEAYYEGAVPIPEKEYRSHIMRYSIKEALDTATGAEHYGKRLTSIMKESIGVLGTIVAGTGFFTALGVVLFTYTPIFTWIGYIFWPFVRIAVPAYEATTATSAAALSFLDITLPSLLVATGEWTLRIRYMIAVVPIAAIVFLGTWVPCIMATDLPVKFSHLVIIWLERMFLSIIFAALFALALFPAGAV